MIEAETLSGRISLPAGLLRVEGQLAILVPGTAGGYTITARTSNGDIGFAAME